MHSTRLSKLMSLVLRHRPDEFDLVLDAEGFVPVDELVAALRRPHPEVTRAEVEHVVAHHAPHKQRFSILDGQVRANYGHSLTGRIEHPPAPPPGRLLHGTHEQAVERILREGLRPMGRQYVHLTPDPAIARQVGGRRGRPVVLVVDAAAAHDAGIAFRPAGDTFWLTDLVPPQFVRSPAT